ncbi:MAG: hypothetical protein IANPNBLG_00858 [Bryobacteraceae bacterium]|nr:hypothetical protein [Bryobacteraceae bacterium]
MREHLRAAVVLLALTAIGYFHFPGHTYLQSDTQIYVPILERLWDPAVFTKEIIAEQPHVTFTIYDEASIGLRRLTGWGFERTLAVQQFAFRFCELYGIYLVGIALGLGGPGALLAAACFGLGATISGPAVLTFEYEPNPRGNAIGLVMLAMGLLAGGRAAAAGAAAGAAFLYHPPTVYPYWAAYFALALIPGKPEAMRRHLKGLLPMAAAVALLLVFSRYQTGEREHQEFFAVIGAAQEAMMRERASYNWISMWPATTIWSYVAYYALMMAALWRLRGRVPGDLRFLVAVMAGVAMCSMPASYLFLEHWKWSLMPQFQPMRALLYVVAFAVLLAACAGVAAARNRGWLEATIWFTAALIPPVSTRALNYLIEWGTPANRRAGVAAVACAVLTVMVLRLGSRLERWGMACVAAAIALPFAVPAVSGVRNYPRLHSAEIEQLASWARLDTGREAVFLFPDAGKSLEPGIFRAESLRAVYVDWKGGGQINFLRDFLTVWRPRWEDVMTGKFTPSKLEHYRAMGIDYVVLPRASDMKGVPSVFANSRYAVYGVRQAGKILGLFPPDLRVLP